MNTETRKRFIRAVALSCAFPLIGATSKAAIRESGYAAIEGIDQWIMLNGHNRRNPVILYVHGGPAEASSPFLSEFLSWERDYTVVNWDQRGSGKTYERYGSSTPNMTANQLVRDTVSIASYACKRLRVPRVILVCQSWGCYLGTHAARIAPELFYAYVGTGQPVNWVLSLEERERFARAQME